MTLAGSNFDTILALYTGVAVNALTLVSRNNDCEASETTVTYSCLTVNITPGTTYWVQVDGQPRERGNAVIALNTFASQPNDAFSTATTMLQASGSTQGATMETGEPRAGAGASGSVWFRFTAPVASTLATVRRGTTLEHDESMIHVL